MLSPQNAETALILWRAILDLKALDSEHIEQKYARDFLSGLALMAGVPAKEAIGSVTGSINPELAHKLCVAEFKRKKFSAMEDFDRKEYFERLAKYTKKTPEQVQEYVQKFLCES